MNKLNRRNFLKAAGVGSAVAVAGVGVPAAGLLMGNASKSVPLTFRAVVGMPEAPLPHYATYVIEGHVDLTNRSGMVTKTVFAGSPQAMSAVALPGLSRIARITDVQEVGSNLRITGIVDDRSQLQRGESPTFTVFIDRSSRILKGEFLGKQVSLLLEH